MNNNTTRLKSLLAPFFIILLVVITIMSCSKEETFTARTSCTIDTDLVSFSSLSCNTATSIDLIAGQTINAGKITLFNDGINLTVTFSTTGGWVLDETHLFAGDCAYIPLNSSCNPQFGLFPFNNTHSPSATSFTYQIPVTSLDSCFCFVAHASVSQVNTTGDIITSETAIGVGPNDLPGNRWGWFSVFCPDNCSPDSCLIEAGDFRTQTQGGWGAAPQGQNPGSYLHANFDNAFPNGITVGCNYTLTLSSAQAVTDFLPQGGGPLPLNTDYNNPDFSISTLAGNLVAVELALGFDTYDATFGASSGFLGDLVLSSGDFSGWSLSDLVSIGNQALGGCNVGYSLSSINDALANASQTFTDGDSYSGFLICP